MQTSLGAPRPVAVPTSVRIKRQRDEPSLPGLVLSGGPTKRPSLASLSISSRLPVQQAESSPDQAPPARCYRLVATVLADGRTLASPARETGAADMAAQKRQARVHSLPRIMKVAVPALQHSPMLGQAADEQTALVFENGEMTEAVCALPEGSAWRAEPDGLHELPTRRLEGSS